VSEETLVRKDNPRLTEGGKATLVEFMDFSCEACGMLYPTMEEIRQEYGDQVTIVLRYFNTNHTNSMKAFQTAEAARAQGKFIEMYERLFETQAEWGESPDDMEQRFFGYAQDLGLDMEKFRADYASKKVADYIESSQKDADEVGVSGTPTLFLDGSQFVIQTQGDFARLKDEVRNAVEN